MEEGDWFADDQYDPEFKVATWEHTILGNDENQKQTYNPKNERNSGCYNTFSS